MYCGTVVAAFAVQSGADLADKSCGLFFCLHPGNAARHDQLSGVSAAGAGGTSGVLGFHGRSGEALWTDRRVSDRVYLHGSDLRLLYRPMERADRHQLYRHGCGNCSGVCIWNGVACVPGGSEHWRGTRRGRASVYRGRSREDGTHAARRLPGACAREEGGTELERV